MGLYVPVEGHVDVWVSVCVCCDRQMWLHSTLLETILPSETRFLSCKAKSTVLNWLCDMLTDGPLITFAVNL